MNAFRGIAIAVFVIDDHPILRDGLRMFLASTDDVRVVGEAATARDAAAKMEACSPHVVLLDLALADEEDGLTALPRLREVAPRARFIAMTGRGQCHAKHALIAGADGFLSKDSAPELMLKAIRRVHAGELWFDRRVLERAVLESIDAARRADPQRTRIGSLTPKERDIAALVGEGLRNEEIAHRLAICEKTVRNHLRDICEKLGVAGRLELLVYANHHGLGRLRPAEHGA